MQKSLFDYVKKGKIQKVVVTSIDGNSDDMIKRRLLEMGVTPQVVITITRVAPLNDPIEVAIRNYKLSFRKEYSKKVLVKEMEGNSYETKHRIGRKS